MSINTNENRGFTPAVQAQKTTFDVVRRERRYVRALEGWIVSAMRADAHERQRRRDERPATG